MDAAKRIVIYGPILLISSILNTNSEFIQKFIILLIKILSGFSAYYCIYNLIQNKNFDEKLTFLISIFTGFIFIYNPIATTMISTTLAFAFAYSFLPLVYLYYSKVSETNNVTLSTLVIVSLLWTFTTAMDIRYLIYIPLFIFAPTFFVTFIFLFSKKQIHTIINLIKNTFLIIVFFILFSLYWILPSLVVSTKSDLVPAYVLTKTMLDAFSRSSLLDVLRLFGDWWPRVQLENITNVPSSIWISASFAITIFAFMPLLYFKNNASNKKNVFALSATTLALIFLVKGSSPPFSNFYVNLYTIPIFGWMFRVPCKFSMLLALNYTLLIGLQLHNIMNYIVINSYNNSKKIIAFSSIILLLISIVIISQPAFTGDYNGKFLPQQLSEEELELNTWLNDQNEYTKILIHPRYIPWENPKKILYSNSNSYLDYSLNSLLTNENSDFGKLLSPLSIQYIIINDLEREEIISKLSLQNNITFLSNCGSYLIFKNNQHESYISIRQQNILLSDGFSKISSLNNVDTYKSAIILDETFRQKSELDTIDIFINPSNPYLALSSIDNKYIINPFIYTFDHNPNNVWSRAATHDPLHGPWHDYLEERGIENWQFDYGKGLVLTWAKKTSLQFSVETETSDEYVLLVRYFENQNGDSINIHLDDNFIHLDTKNQLNKFIWKNLGTYHLEKGKHEIILENLEGLNAVNLFVLIPEDEYKKAQSEFVYTIQNKRVIHLFEAESDIYREYAEVNNAFDEASNGKVLTFNQNGHAWQEIEVLKNDSYMMAVQSSGKLEVSVDDRVYHLNNQGLNLTYLGPLELEKGKHTIDIITSEETNKQEIGGESKFYLDVIWLYSTKNNETLDDILSSNEVAAEIQNYEKINPTKYKVQVKASSPYMLSLAESYNPLWVAEIDTAKGVKKYEPIPLYSTINGFWIDEPGEYTITIRYKPQQWFYYGVVVSVFAFIACICGLFYNWRKGEKKIK
ncbi:hypothetical protein ACT9XH_01875 [Methanococcoides methylutens]|uniref:hypothetical protein n=1 Tax=Methanococcoides methylutens TaxID=2226 RepID=UPI004044A739